MNITAESYGHAVILHLKGELTEDALEALDRAVQHHLAGSDVVDLVLDLEAVPFVDGRGLEYLLDLQDRLNERLGQVRLARCDENVRMILHVTRLDSSFELYDGVPQAVQALSA